MCAWTGAFAGNWVYYKAIFRLHRTPAGHPSAIALLNASGLATAVLSLPARTVGFLEERAQQQMVRKMNA